MLVRESRISRRIKGFRFDVATHFTPPYRPWRQRLAFVPEWDDDLPGVDNLSFFPGSQIMIVVPSQSGAPQLPYHVRRRFQSAQYQ